MATHNISISIKVLTTGISIDINTESPPTANVPIKIEKKEEMTKLLPLYDDNVIKHTECTDVTALEDDEETITTDDTEDDEEETNAIEDSDDEDDDEDDVEQISKISRLN